LRLRRPPIHARTRIRLTAPGKNPDPKRHQRAETVMARDHILLAKMREAVTR